MHLTCLALFAWKNPNEGFGPRSFSSSLVSWDALVLPSVALHGLVWVLILGTCEYKYLSSFPYLLSYLYLVKSNPSTCLTQQGYWPCETGLWLAHSWAMSVEKVRFADPWAAIPGMRGGGWDNQEYACNSAAEGLISELTNIGLGQSSHGQHN